MSKFQKLIGKTVIVSLTYVDQGGTLLRRVQYSGRIIRATDQEGIVIETWFGLRTLPPDVDALFPAPPGEYRFKETGEVGCDPDLQATFTITKADEQQT